MSDKPKTKSKPTSATTAQTYSLIAIAIFGLIVTVVEFISEQTNVLKIVLSLAIVLIAAVAATIKATAQANGQIFAGSKANPNDLATISAVIIDSVAEGIVSIDGSGKIELINPEAQKLIGWKKEESVGIDYVTVLQVVNNAGKPIDEELDPIKKAISTGNAATSRSINLKTFSGRIIPVNILATPVRDESKSTIVTFRNISHEIKEEREQKEFISTASHEMRTPVAAIDGYIGLALNEKTASIDERARNFLYKAKDSTRHLGELYSNLLNISKAEDGRLDMDLKVINIVELAETVTENHQMEAKEKEIELKFLPTSNIEGGIRKIAPVVYINADRHLLTEAISNLVSNAIKYTEKGSVEVDVGIDDNDNALITITDSGIGIPPEDIDHLFQKFYRVDNSQTRERNGTGLGLYLTRKIIENFHGRVWAKSTFGKGSSFFASLPRLSTEKATQMLRLEAQTVRGGDLIRQRTPSSSPLVSQSTTMSSYAPPKKDTVEPQKTSNYQTISERSAKEKVIEPQKETLDLESAPDKDLEFLLASTDTDQSLAAPTSTPPPVATPKPTDLTAKPSSKDKPAKTYSALLVPDKNDASNQEAGLKQKKPLDDDQLLEILAASKATHIKDPLTDKIVDVETIASAWTQKEVTLDDIKKVLSKNSRFANKFRDKIEQDEKIKRELSQQKAATDSQQTQETTTSSESVVEKVKHHTPAIDEKTDQLTIDLIEKYKESYLELLPHNILKKKHSDNTNSKH